MRNASTGLVLTYHEVLPDAIEIPSWLVVRESAFRKQMEFLYRAFDVISLEKACERLTFRPSEGKPFAVVTFDDGYRGCLVTALPILRKYRMPFTLYATTRPMADGIPNWHDAIINLFAVGSDIDITLDTGEKQNRFLIPQRAPERTRWAEMRKLLLFLKDLRPKDRQANLRRLLERFPEVPATLKTLTIEELRRLAESPLATVGSHTHGHELLPQLGHSQIRDTVRKANSLIEEWTGSSPRHFAYPNGDYTAAVQEIVAQEGFQTIATTEPGWLHSLDQRLSLPRVSVGRFANIRQFAAIVSSSAGGAA